MNKFEVFSSLTKTEKPIIEEADKFEDKSETNWISFSDDKNNIVDSFMNHTVYRIKRIR